MALGRAFIEVHADLRPFKKQLAKDVADIVKETQKAVEKAVKEATESGGDGGGGKGSGGKGAARPKIKPQIDTTDADRQSRGFFGRLAGYAGKAFDKTMDGFAFAIKNSDSVETGAIALAAIVATVASPLIAAAIGGAITAGIGLAGIGAGVALAFQDARIQSAANAMWERFTGQAERSARFFVQPVLRAIDVISGAFDRFAPRIDRIFAAIAPYVDDLAHGISGFLDALGPGLEAAFGNAGPLLQVVAEFLPIIGDAFGQFLELVSSSPGVIAGLVGAFQIAADLLIYTGEAIKFLSDRFADFVYFLDSLPDAIVPDGIQQDVDEMIAAMERSEEPSAKFGQGLFKIKTEGAGAAKSATDLTASLNTFFGTALTAMDVAIRFEESLDGVTASFKENGRNIDINTAKGRANVSAVNDTIKAAIAARDAKIKETGSVVAGNSVYSTYISRLRATLTAAGLTEGQINDLIGAYDDIPPGVSTDVSAPGLSSALSQAEALQRLLSSINSQSVRIRQAGRNGSSGGVGGYAEGGVVRREELAWHAEGNKPEAIVPLTNPRRAAEVMNEAGLTGFGGGTITVQLIMDGKVIEEKVVQVNQAQARQIQNQPRRVL